MDTLSRYGSDLGNLDQVLSGGSRGARFVRSYNREEALGRVGDDIDLLKEIAQMFLDDCESMMSAVERAVVSADAKGLERSAHTLKGCVSNFGAEAAFDAAFDLEKFGRAKELDGVPPAYARLQTAIQTLCPDLEALVAE